MAAISTSQPHRIWSEDAIHLWRVYFFSWVDRNKRTGHVFNLSDNIELLHLLWRSETVTWLRAKCLFKGETLMKAKHHLFLISYQNGIWFFSKHSTSTIFFLYLLSSRKKVSLPLNRNLVIWKLSCRKQAEQLCRAAADGGAHHHLPEGLNASGWARHKNCNKRDSSCLTKFSQLWSVAISVTAICEMGPRGLFPSGGGGCQAPTSQLDECSTTKYKARPHKPVICSCPRWINSEKKYHKTHI